MRSPTEIWERAKCREVGANLRDFYPKRDRDQYGPSADRAKAVCRGRDGGPVCRVLLECLAYALLTEDRFGIWGGLSPRERNALRRSRDLSRYRAAVQHRNSPYFDLIQNYLEHLDATAKDDPGRTDAHLPGHDEARVGPARTG